MPPLRPLAALLPVALGLLLMAALACGASATPKPTPPATVPPQPTPLPAYAELQAAAQGLLDDLRRAFATDDGALLAAILSEEVAEVCSPEELQLWAESEEDVFGGLETAAVFLDLANYNRAWVGLRSIGSGNDELLGFPLPIERGLSSWRLKLTTDAILRDDECPFVPRQTAQGEAGGPTPTPPPFDAFGLPEIPGLPNLAGRMFRPAPPGMTTRGSNSSSSTSSSPEDGLFFFESSGDLQGGGTAAEIIGHYREQWAGPGWLALDEQSADGVARFSWLVRDAGNRLWRGLLVAARLEDGRWRIWLTLQTAEESAAP